MTYKNTSTCVSYIRDTRWGSAFKVVDAVDLKSGGAPPKLGVLVASSCAAILGLILGRLLLTPVGKSGAAQTADEAESSTEV